MKHLLPTDPELLVELAAQAGLEYLEAYYVWSQVHDQADAYTIVEAVLYVARMHRLPVCLALLAYQMQPAAYPVYELSDWVTA